MMKFFKLFIAMIIMGLFMGACAQVLQPEEETSFLQTGESSSLKKYNLRSRQDVRFSLKVGWRQ
jgi:hypothetical protein